MGKCKMFTKCNLNKILIKLRVLEKWKRFYSSSSNVLNNEEEVYKYSCLVPYKNDTILSLEHVYDEKYRHIFSENNVEIESNLFYLYNLLINSRTVEQIRLVVHNSYCAYENNFIKDVKNINWSAYIPFSSVYIEPQINIRSIKSRLYHTCMLKNIILSVIKRQQQLYIEKNGDQNIFLKKKKVNPTHIQPLKVNVLFKYNEMTISINLSNDMNKRIYEAYKNKNSLKSTIIASAAFKINILKYINPSKKLYIIDPFCNDGTLLVEIANILLSMPNGSPSINYPILTFPMHSPSAFYSVLNEITICPSKNIREVYLLGIDEDRGYIQHANENLKRLIETMPISTSEECGTDNGSTLTHMYKRSDGRLAESFPNNGESIHSCEGTKECSDGRGNLTSGKCGHFKKGRDFSYDINVISTKELEEIFPRKSSAHLSNSTFLAENIKFYALNFLHLYNIAANCILITNLLNQEKKKIIKFERLLLRSEIVNAFVFSQEKYREKTHLKFRIILRFVSNGQNIIFLQLFGKAKRKDYDELDDF
ncbi:conserved Plasmodium protein, unknown function [Plasmodium ovale]|uniref:Ribosomal RNA large subunit methyltransferase K/L-like methyltransferase domain-containing protein n=1 Tax=Plasmodium ovale TaxID=36330 RepID=A0A1D3TG64_PLAOA|nr:conserved Plasmodium protein, unknown function [Plasmodium ovale]